MSDNSEQIYGGRWRVIGEIGRGGQGIVYKVEDISGLESEDVLLESFNNALQNATASIAIAGQASIRNLVDLIKRVCTTATPPRAALKKLLPPEEAVNSNTAWERMRFEIATMREITHPSLIPIFDKDIDDRWYVTKFFRNGSLARKSSLYKNRPLDSLRALQPIVQVVAQLHQRSFVHRDIKPDNLFIGDQAGHLVLGDCGLAFTGEGEDRVTGTFENVGSRDWMPGWAMGQRLADVQPNFDVFSLGKVLWSMISGRETLQLWYHQRPQFNLGSQFPDNESIAFIQEILDKTVVEEPTDCIPDATELLTLVDRAIDALERNVRIVDNDLLRRCLVCSTGQYKKTVDCDIGAQRNFGLEVVGHPRFRIFVCEDCGHSQFFYSMENNRLPE